MVGGIDHATGVEVPVFPLYFLPLAFAARYLGRTGAAIISLAATIVWSVTLYTAGGQYSHFYIAVISFFTQGSTFFIFSFLMAALSDALRRERLLSRKDSLTGLANRRSFIEDANGALALCQRYRRPVSLAYIDLDNFKNINDSLGHDAGDRVLRECSEIIVSCVRASDIAARLGGDEFAVFLPETTAQNAAVVLDKIRLLLAQSPQLQTLHLTASIGLVTYQESHTDIHILLRAADRLMYDAKRASKNRVLTSTLP